MTCSHRVMLTRRLRLRPPTEEDLDFILDIYSRREVMRHIGSGDVQTTRDQAQQRLERYRALSSEVNGVWLVEKHDDGEPAGFALLKHIPFSDHAAAPSQDVEIGWHLHPQAWGSGFATEAARALIDRAQAGGLPRLVAVTHPENAASQAVALRLGMTHRGRTERYYDTVCELFTLDLR